MSKKVETIANIILIIAGITCGTVFFLQYQTGLSTVFFAIALACILYQFLGGIGSENKFNLGAMKFGGSVAVIIGFMYFLNNYIFKDQKTIIETTPKTFITIDEDFGESLMLKIKKGNDSIQITDKVAQSLRSKQYFKPYVAGNNIELVTTGPKKEKIGYFPFSKLKTFGLFNQLEIDNQEKRIQVFTLYPDNELQNSTKDLSSLDLPFEIRTFKGSRFEILVNDSVVFNNNEIVARTSYIIPINDDEFYILFLEQASNIISQKNPKRYSKWLAKKTRKKFTNIP